MVRTVGGPGSGQANGEGGIRDMTTQTATCAGSTTCRRPANWSILEMYGRVYVSSGGRYDQAYYCKAHGEQALEAARLALPDAERMRRYRVTEERNKLLNSVPGSPHIQAAQWGVDRLRAGEKHEWGDDQEPDPEFAAKVEAVIAMLGGIDWEAYDVARTALWEAAKEF